MALTRMRPKIPELQSGVGGPLRRPSRVDAVAASRSHRSAHRDDRTARRGGGNARSPLSLSRSRRLCTIPGIGQRTAEVVIAEIGVDMGRFPTAEHLASWAGLCPGHHESAGKRRSGKARKGDAALRVALCEAAWSAARTRDTYLGAQFRRFSRRMGKTQRRQSDLRCRPHDDRDHLARPRQQRRLRRTRRRLLRPSRHRRRDPPPRHRPATPRPRPSPSPRPPDHIGLRPSGAAAPHPARPQPATQGILVSEAVTGGSHGSKGFRGPT